MQDVLDALATAGYRDVEQVETAHEDLMFSLPKELRVEMKATGDSSRALGGHVR